MREAGEPGDAGGERWGGRSAGPAQPRARLRMLGRQNMDQPFIGRLPIISVLFGVVLLAVATVWYPGGYRWGDHTISALFQRVTSSGVSNPAWPLAMIGVLAVMSGIALLFYCVSQQTCRRFHKTTIQIAGIAATVFATLTVALLHDLMAALALVSFLVAVVAVLHVLYDDRAIGLLALGVLSLAIELGTGVLYFGRIWLQFLPVAQKAALGLVGFWLLLVQHRSRLPRASQPAPS